MPMPRTLALLLLLATAPLAAPAAEPAPDKPLYAEGRMLVLVAPRFPKDALARGQTGKVEVFGTVRTDGRLENIRIEATPPGEPFESAVMDVAPLWRLQPRIVSPGCSAEDTEGRVTIWFEIDGARPKVSYGTRPPAGSVAPEIVLDRKPDRMVGPQYPPKLAADPKMPKSILQVAYVAVAEDGAVTGVTVAPLLHYREFEPYVAAALRQWKYPRQHAPWCTEVQFNMELME
jgi:TonB family protein